MARNARRGSHRPVPRTLTPAAYEGIGRAAHLCKRHRSTPVPAGIAAYASASPVTEATKAVALQRRAAAARWRRAYAAVAAALLPALWRDRAARAPARLGARPRLPGHRGRRRDLRRARPARPAAARRPRLALARGVARRARCRRCCSSPAGATAPSSSAGSGATLEAEERVSHARPRARGGGRDLDALGRARDPVEVARPLVRAGRRRSSASASPASSLVDDDRRARRPASTASSTARRRRLVGATLDVDLAASRPGIASAVFDAAPGHGLRRRELAARQPAPRRARRRARAAPGSR